MAATIIFLHGLGDSGAGWSALAPAITRRPNASSWKFVFPDAPVRPVSLADGQKMPAWFDLDALPVTLRTPDDEAGYANAARSIHAMIDAEVAKGTPASRIFLGGFSQGGALSLFAGLSYREALGGVISFWAKLKSSPALAGSNLLVIHGDEDDKVLFECGERSRDVLTPHVKTLTFKTAEFGHSLHPSEPGWLHAFILESLSSASGNLESLSSASGK
jgi:predicted esterase